VEEQVDAHLSALCLYDISHRWLQTETVIQIPSTLIDIRGEGVGGRSMVELVFWGLKRAV